MKNRIESEETECARAGFVRIESDNPFAHSLWSMPNGAKHVVLVDDSEETWNAYCETLVESLKRKANP